jgi:hypothetical protein
VAPAPSFGSLWGKLDLKKPTVFGKGRYPFRC